MMHCLGFSIYSNGCEKRTIRPLLFHSYLLFKHSFYIIPQFMVFLQVKFGFSILFKIFLTPQTRLFPGFFRSFQFFAKKIKKVLAFSCKVRYTKRVGWQGQLVKGLRRRPLTAKTRVRFSYWLLGTSEVIRKFFLLFEYIPAWVMPSLFVQKDAAKRLFSSTLRRLDSDLRQSES